MAVIPAAPILLTNCTVSIGTDSYEAACRAVRFTPTTPKVQWKGLAKNTKSFVGTPTWVVAITFAQDIASTTSLSKYLHTTAPGTVVTLAFDPVAGGATVTASILVEPGDLGGDIDTVPEAAVTFAVDGQPTIGV